jgi:ribosomal protein S7
MAFKLSYELMDATKDNGNVRGRNEETHEMAETNITFTHIC